MPAHFPRALPDLSALGWTGRWPVLLLLTVVIAYPLSLARFPAAILLGAVGAGILTGAAGGQVRVPRPLVFFCQSVVGCVIARSITREILSNIYGNWPLFILLVMSASMAATALGWLLAKNQVLPGSTAIWGTSPGAALVMTLMSESFGADPRLVAFMQYSRVVMVSLSAAAMSAVWGGTGEIPRAVEAAAALDWAGVLQTILLACAGTLAGLFLKMPAGPILTPLLLGSALNIHGVIHIELPWWLPVAAYCVVGWSIGLRFTRDILRHTARVLPKVVASIFALIVLCGALALVLARIADIDPMTAYLATSPGGMDTVAIISATAGGDISFIMAVQTTRFLLVSATAPAIAAFVAKKTGTSGKK